ncbi:putative matrilysin [Helianthus annuus]|uniref:Matrilysin n=1 Tax=Helianthus annuus TaxID=4232 RepID=A0A251VBP3_HELAN|nr:metalloendoproteinase 3-MMP [Helianthus annuus]KAF5816693.1 putative matrilysin [Helianthus annuus]KAJ0594922.1 putative matrilysin [Helianthus annuus]KAJ0603259.1 putative matrilysin [Helianthus annuus]KAJ0609966.1 putative matrilysin [Helianthus annuus]KAJ0775751.1 putative matrilysin [Helianthus annuus]
MVSILSFSFSCIFFLFSFVLPLFSSFQYSQLQENKLLDNTTNPSPFGFLKNLKGCQKGDKVKGLSGLKLYLSHFGYLNYQTNSNVTNPKEDYFDEELEAAIKSYQAYYRLNATGVLDEATLSMMVLPRCGFPDKETHRHSDQTLYNVPHYRFFPNRPKWPNGKRHLTYGFGSRFPTRFVPPITRAFSRWATTSQYFTFSRATTPQSADLKISFARYDHGDGATFDGPGGVMAHGFAPNDGRLHFDADDHWAVGGSSNAFDIETVALHEIGHLLGLGHSQYPNAVMYGTISPGESRVITLDDIRGLRALYGS